MEVLVVLHQDRDGVALAQTVAPEEVRQPVRAGLELAERHRRSRRMHDDGGLVGVRFGMLANLHAQNSTMPELDRCQEVGKRRSMRLICIR